MTNSVFKNSVIALAISLALVSCGGGNSNAQQQSGKNNEPAKTETKGSSAVAGSMDTMAAGDVAQSWSDGLAAKSGIKNLGKPKGTTEVRASDWEDGFTVYFFCDKPVETFNSYTKSVWDLSKSAAEKGELLLRIYENGDWKYKPVGSLEKAEDDSDDYRYRWYYSFGGVIWQVYIRVNTVGSDKGSIQLTIEKK